MCSFQIFICLMENGSNICIPNPNEDEYLKKTKRGIYCRNSWAHKKHQQGLGQKAKKLVVWKETSSWLVKIITHETFPFEIHFSTKHISQLISWNSRSSEKGKTFLHMCSKILQNFHFDEILLQVYRLSWVVPQENEQETCQFLRRNSLKLQPKKHSLVCLS